MRSSKRFKATLYASVAAVLVISPNIVSAQSAPSAAQGATPQSSVQLADAQIGQANQQLAQAQPAGAQTAQTQPAVNGQFEEITVTARKREESIQAVPIAITAFTQADLDDKGVKTLEDLKFVSPSVYIQSDVFQQDTLNVTIRGQRNFAQNGVGNGVEFDTAAAVYINGIYMARTQGLEGSLFDVDNVEVLKGPQGTLVGRNSTGGAVLYTTKEPQDTLGGSLDLGGGDYGQRSAQGILNVPVSSQIAVRTALSYSESTGWLKNLYYDPTTSYHDTTNGFGYRKLSGQFAVKWTPDDSFKLVLRGDFEGEHDTGSGYHDLSSYVGTVLSVSRPSICNIPGSCTTSTAPAGTGFTDLLGRYIAPYYTTPPSGTTAGVVNTNPADYNALLNSLAREQSDFWTEDQHQDPNVDHFHTISFLADKSFDNEIDIKWVGGYRWFDTLGVSYSRGDPYDTTQTTYDIPNYKAYTSDLTVNGSAVADKLKWTVGAFFFKESATGGQAQYLYSPNYPQPAAISGHQVTLSDASQNTGHNESYALYDQETYSILPDLRLTGGVRYTIDDRAANIVSTTVRFPATAATTATVANSVFNAGSYVLNGISYSGYSTTCAIQDANGVPLPLNSCFFGVSTVFKKPTWNISLDYDLFDKTLVYVTTRKGYRSGGINVGQNGSNSNLLVAQPEDVQDYEAGIKSEWNLAGMPMRTNVDAYLTNYNNIQTAISLPFVALAVGPGGSACTQTAFNAGQCTGTSSQSITVNAKAAKIYGFEWDFDAKPLPPLTIGWSGSYLHAYYTDFSFAVPAGYLLPATGTNLNNTPFPLPQWQTNAYATYAIPGSHLGLPLEAVSFTAQWYWQSDFKANFTGYQFPAQKAYGYQFTNLRMNIENIKDTKVSMTAYVSNLFNKAACQPEYNGTLNSVPNATNGTPNTSGIVQCVPLPPRMFGANVKYTF